MTTPKQFAGGMGSSPVGIINFLPGVADTMPKPRYQNPTILQSKGDKPIWYIRPWIDVMNAGKLGRGKKRIVLGPVAEMGKREAIAKKNAIMATINRSDYVLQSQINFADFVDHYLRGHVKRDGILAASTREKYLNHIKNHILPAFEKLMMCQINTQLIESWLDDRKKAGLSHSTRMDLRNILSGIFKKAADWGHWQDRNPVEAVSLGRAPEREQAKKLSADEQRALLAALPEDVCLIVETALSCALRISEILGVRERDLDFDRNMILIRRRFWRGDIDVPKNSKPRDVAMGDLTPRIKRMLSGNPDAFVFRVETKPLWGRKRAICRDDRAIHQHFLRPAAELLGLYRKGFGFHSFRREAITELSATGGVSMAMRVAGHSTADMSLHYTLADDEAQNAAVRKGQERRHGKVGRA